MMTDTKNGNFAENFQELRRSVFAHVGIPLNIAAHQIQSVRATGYDGTITLEVFSEYKHYLAHSRDLLRKIWEQTEPPGSLTQTASAVHARLR